MTTNTAPQPPARRSWFARHKIITGAGIAVILLIVIGAIAGGGRDGEQAAAPATAAATDAPVSGTEAETPAEEPPAEPEAPAEPGIGQPVTAGNFEFTALAVEEIGTSVGNEFAGQNAQGRYVAVSLRVANTGNSAATFFSDNVQIIDASDRTFDSDTTATLYAAPTSDAWLSEINPGNAFEGRIVFDLPADATPAVLVVKDNAFAGGERIRL